MKKLPRDAEASNVLVGEVDFLDAPFVAFVRLQHAVMLGGLTEVPVPTRYAMHLSPLPFSPPLLSPSSRLLSSPLLSPPFLSSPLPFSPLLSPPLLSSLSLFRDELANQPIRQIIRAEYPLRFSHSSSYPTPAPS